MICINKRCNKEIGDSKFCPYCGKNQSEKNRRNRTKGSGSIYKRKDNKSKPYTASVRIAGKNISIGTFETKAQASKALAEYIRQMEVINTADGIITVKEVFYKYVEPSFQKLSDSLRKNYMITWHRIEPLHNMYMYKVKAVDIQSIVNIFADEHQQLSQEGQPLFLDSQGKKTIINTGVPRMVPALSKGSLNLIKLLMSKIFKVALDNDWALRDYSKNIDCSTPTELRNNKSRFTESDLNFMFERMYYDIPGGNYLDYVLCMCYLSFRVTEFITLKKEQYFISKDGIPYFVAGMKTKAGTDRKIPVHPKIQSIVERCIERGGETIFCNKDDNTALSYNRFRYRFDKNMSYAGFSRMYTPHSCRRTFSTRLSAAGVNDADLIALMGHTDIEIDYDHYINQEIETLYNSILKMK